jgi:integrase
MGKRWRKYANGRFRLGQLNKQAVAVWRDDYGTKHRYRLEAWTESEGRSALDAFVRKRDRLTGDEATTIAAIYASYQADREKDGKQAANFVESWKALKGRFANLTPDDITADLCRAYTTERTNAGKSAGTAWTELTRLRSALHWAKRHRIIKEVPYVWIPQKPPAKTRVLNQAEVIRLLEGCKMPHVRLFVILALCTGGRTGALLELTWDRVDLEAGTIDLRIDEPSNPLLKTARKGRAKVPMNNLARAALQEARQGALTDFVVEWDGEPIKSVRKGFSEACRRAGLEDVTPHTLRHTAASWMESGGIPMGQISRFLGHKTESVTRNIYSKPDTKHLQPAAKILDLSGDKPGRTSTGKRKTP